ncbi:hypothetical protein M2138_001050, partial [Dysgonomonadaceae bacterium PH5-43]|nr:hypothetical protein [Dysgonomonadaceae bacterium PH5-43]
MNKIYLSLLILCLFGIACVKTEKTSSEENSTDFNKLDSIVVKANALSETRMYLNSFDKYDQRDDFSNQYDLSHTFVGNGPYIELREDFSLAFYKRLSAQYWLKNGNDYKITGYAPQPLIKSENADATTDAEAVFFKELIETVYTDLEYKKSEEYGMQLIMNSVPDETDPDYEEYLSHEKQKAAAKRFYEEEIIHLKYKETYDKQLSFLEERKETVSPEFYELCKSFFFCDYIKELVGCYLSYKTEDLKEQLKEQLLATKADFQNDKLMFSPRYRYMAISYNLFHVAVDGYKYNDLDKLYQNAKENFTGKTREFLLFYWAKKIIKQENIAFTKQYLEEASDEDYKAYIAAKLQLLEMNQAIDN